ncbi:hypothetical protein AVEN_66831-1 [Araneus ventricosus]|uniref:Transposable element Tc1 transposase n=1 Tax=Araneus ventricosus TaxID=182803 RepID=A0A4Y2DNT6_ARAVE|nr:hypothetical protein AVEN_66831-1 [Araneus ventricosus]
MDEWKRVAWSDESRFIIHHVDGRVRVRRLPGEQLLPSCTAGHTQAGGGGIMLCGMFSWAALVPVVVVEQTKKAANYLNQDYLRIVRLGSQRADELMMSDWEHAFCPSVT